jgi:LmbE family N-acetylglucosaminyl deacetylase
MSDTTHLFLSPHPDDVALSCGGLVAQLRARGEHVAIATFYGGAGSLAQLTPYQCEALGFGERRVPLAPTDVMEERAREDRAYAAAVDAGLVGVGLPDAVFRGYEGDAALLGEARPDDPVPASALAELLHALRPHVAYVPLSIGGHVDHRQVFRAGIYELAGGRAGSFSSLACRLVFYEDSPYSWWSDFRGLEHLRPDQLADLPHTIELRPEYVPVDDWLGRKLKGIRAYSSQIHRLFGSDAEMERAVRERAEKVGEAGGFGPAERFWRAEAHQRPSWVTGPRWASGPR